MPKISLNPLEKPPDEPHLGLYTDPEFTIMDAIPPGAVMGIVEDPRKNDPMHRMVLMRVRHKEIIFKCCCKDSCRILFHYKLMPVVGKHG